MPHLLLFIIGLFLIAALFRVDFFFYLLYVFFGVYFLSRLWTERALRNVTFEREHVTHAFLGERVPVKLRIRNRGALPLPWLRIHESLPIQLKSPNFFRCVLSLLPYEERALTYELDCRRRGFYPLGPMTASSGDLFGVAGRQKRVQSADAVTVYPRIVPLTSLSLPAQTPFGSVASKQRVFEDPARIIGIREYQAGDSMRNIHWKASAATSVLQVKRFQPAISVEAQLFLNLNRDEYTRARAGTATELAIVTAASIANYLIERRQTVGLSCNGQDPIMQQGDTIALPPRGGRERLMHILDILARIRASQGPPFADVLRQASLNMTWGGTGIIISADADDVVFDHMVLMKRSGFHVVLILVDPKNPFVGIQQRAQDVGIRAYQIWQEKDLDVWRQARRSFPGA